MYHFNENNIVTGYIKELLHNFNLPTCNVYLEGDEVYPRTNYIYNHKLILTNQNDDEDGDNYDSSVDGATDIIGHYKIVKDYVFGQDILNLTKHLKLNSIYYDTYTHEYLGNYLRFYRDYVGVDLMMLYNCFSNRVAENLNYSYNSTSFTTSDDNYKIYLVPVRFNKKYLIGIDSDTDVEFVCGLVDDNVQVTSQNTDSLYEASYVIKNPTSFTHPFEYSTYFGKVDNDLKKFENCLRLIIKLPVNNKSSISIVEVTNSSSYFEQMVDGNVAEFTPDGDTVYQEYPSKLSLFKVNDGIHYPFADRLLEYLFGQAVVEDDQIGENIERVKEQLINAKQKVKNGVKLDSSKYGTMGVWNDVIRKLCYGAAIYPHTNDEIKFNQKNYDLTYYVDKDIESLIAVTEETI